MTVDYRTACEHVLHDFRVMKAYEDCRYDNHTFRQIYSNATGSVFERCQLIGELFGVGFDEVYEYVEYLVSKHVYL